MSEWPLKFSVDDRIVVGIFLLKSFLMYQNFPNEQNWHTKIQPQTILDLLWVVLPIFFVRETPAQSLKLLSRGASSCPSVTCHDLFAPRLGRVGVVGNTPKKKLWKWPFIVDFPMKNGDLPSGKLPELWKITIFFGKSTISTGPCSIANC